MYNLFKEYANKNDLQHTYVCEFHATLSRFLETRKGGYLKTCFLIAYNIGYEQALNNVREDRERKEKNNPVVSWEYFVEYLTTMEQGKISRLKPCRNFGSNKTNAERYYEAHEIDRNDNRAVVLARRNTHKDGKIQTIIIQKKTTQKFRNHVCEDELIAFNK